MYNKISCFFAGFLLLGAATGAHAQTSKIKSINYENFEVPQKTEEKALSLTKKELKEFDEKGRMNHYELFVLNPGNELVPKISTTKEWKENLRIETVVKFDDMGDKLRSDRSFYNLETKKKDKLEFVDYLKAPGVELTKYYKYHSNNKPKVILLKNAEGKVVGKESYKYNSNDEELKYQQWYLQANGAKFKEAKVTAYNKDGSLKSSTKTSSDGKDKFKEVITFERSRIKKHLKYVNGELTSTFGGRKATYDPSKQRVLMSFGNDDGGMAGFLSSEDEFDDNGNRIKTTEYLDDIVAKVINYTYNEQNKLVSAKTIKYREEAEVGTEEEIRDYDKVNNLLRITIKKDGVVVKEDKYDYKYY